MENFLIDFKNIENAKAANNEVYNNLAAHNEVKAMMKRKERIDVRFYTARKDGVPSAIVESKRVEKFTLQLNEKELNWLIYYLIKGEDNGAETEPMNVKPYETEEKGDFQVNLFQQMVKGGYIPQLTPGFRVPAGRVKANIQFLYGIVVFYMVETEELNEFIEENNLC